MQDPSRIDRRSAIQRLSALAAGAAASTLPATLLPSTLGAEPPAVTTGMGLVIYDCGIRRRWLQRRNPRFDLFEPLTFLDYCRKLGAGGMQARLGVMDTEAASRLREFAQRQGLFIDAIASPPADESDVERFEAEIRTAAAVGVQAVRTVVMPGRRYERFTSLAEFREFEKRGRRMAELAAPVVERHRVPLAIENHKDQRNDERLALLEHIGSEYVGACVDTGNSFALLEDPLETVELLAPWAKTVHLKDQGVRSYDDGFLLGDIPLGQGCLELAKMVQVLRKAQPGIRFTLELITRDPLKVPCLTDQYWATMPHVPGRDLARTLRIVRDRSAPALQQVSSLALEDQVALEDANVTASLTFAREKLRL
jgi:sugar phosphate isomerase/epimerase